MTIEYDKPPWGFESNIINTELYGSKVLIVLEGESLPYIYHKKRDKTLFILQGVVKLVIEGRTKILNEQDIYRIRPMIKHRLIALGGDVTIIEVGTKIEDDVVIVEE
jgi:mannose-6-phosphate isomerase-like protein (cupin superfamily)